MSTLRFTVTFHGPFRVGTGTATPGAHQTAWQDSDGEHMLVAPASTVKGIMRASAAGAVPGSLVEEVFGSGERQCPWAWSPLAVPASAVCDRRRTRIEIDPETGTVARDMLAVAEELVIEGPGTFTIRRLGFVRLDPDAAKRHEAALMVAAGLTTGMGGTRRRGLGWISICPEVSDPSHRLRGGSRGASGADWWCGMTLQTYRAKLVTQEPVSLGIESEIAFRRDIYRYIPGIVLRGALAALWIGRYGEPTSSDPQRFRRLFEVGLRPGPLLPIGSDVIPISVSWCKYPINDVHKTRSTVDDAFADPSDPRKKCGVDGCAAPIERGRGDVEFAPGTDPITSITHVPHEPSGTAKVGALHARRYLRPSTEFSGWLVAPSDEFLDTFAGGEEIWLGGRRTVAGRAALTLTPDQPPTPGEIAAGERIAVRLTSAAVFVDAAGCPVFDPAAELARGLGVSVDDCRIESGWWRPTTIGGWHMATGLPKPVDRGVVPGSTWAVRLSRPVSGDRVAALLRDGVGLRRAEGFGRIELVRSGWRPPGIPAAPKRHIEHAVARAARLSPFVARDRVPREALLGHLRELAGRHPTQWPEVSAAFWRRKTGEQLARTGVRRALQELVDTADSALLRDVRCVLDAAWARRPTPQWLTAQLAAVAASEEGPG